MYACRGERGHSTEGHLGGTSFDSAGLTIDGEPSGAVMGHFETVRPHEWASGAEWDRVGTVVFQFTPTDTIVAIGAVNYPPSERFTRATVTLL